MSNLMSFIVMHWVWVHALCGLMRGLLMRHDPDVWDNVMNRCLIRNHSGCCFILAPGWWSWKSKFGMACVSMHQLTSAENELLCSGCYDYDWMHRLLIDRLVAWLLYRFNVRLKIKWLVGRSIYWSIASLIILSVDWLIYRMNDCWIMDCLNDWSID